MMASPESVKQLYISIANLVYVETQLAKNQQFPFDASDDVELGAQADRIVDFGKDLRQANPIALNQAKVDDARRKVKHAQAIFDEIIDANKTAGSKHDVFTAVIDVIAALADVLNALYLGDSKSAQAGTTRAIH
jgi:hypothetical protein